MAAKKKKTNVAKPTEQTEELILVNLKFVEFAQQLVALQDATRIFLKYIVANCSATDLVELAKMAAEREQQEAKAVE